MPEADASVHPDPLLMWHHSLRVNPLSLPFHDGDVAVEGKIGKPLNRMAWSVATSLRSNQACFALSDAQNHAGIVGRKITTSSHIHSAALQIVSLISDARAHGVDV